IQRQMNNKRPISEVYLEKETVDNNELQESECESMVSEFSDTDESVEKNSIVFGLKVGDELDNWDAAERQVGFELVKRRLEKNKHGEIIFECKHSGKYQEKKKADNEDIRERESTKMNCPWKINLNLSDGVVRITLLNNEHNHLLYKNIKDISSKHRRLNPEMLNQVEFLVKIGCEAGMIIRGLQKNFPNAIIYPKNVYNAIHLFKRNEQLVKTDASETYRRLMQLQREETDTQIQLQLDKEEYFERCEELYNQNSSIGLPNIIGRYFKRIDNMIKKYLTSLMLKAQRQQMNEKDNNKSKNDDVKFVEDDYESSMLNLYSMMQGLDLASVHKVWSVSTIEENKTHFIALYGKEVAITVCSNQQASNNEFIFEHQIATNFDMLNEIRHTHKLSETVRQNLSRKTKNNQGFGYAKKAIDLALQLGQEDELNTLLLDWIKEKETEIYDKQLDHKISISNPYQVHTKGARKKCLKSALDDVSNAIANKQCNSKTDKDIGGQGKRVCSNCKSTGHNARTCDLKKNKS
ncbi:2625_t:CDS:2, partial [Gigaspora rosea]